MSIKSTHFVDRSTAISAIEHKLRDASNEEIAQALEYIYSDFSHFKNYDVRESHNLGKYDEPYHLTLSDFING